MEEGNKKQMPVYFVSELLGLSKRNYSEMENVFFYWDPMDLATMVIMHMPLLQLSSSEVAESTGKEREA